MNLIYGNEAATTTQPLPDRDSNSSNFCVSVCVRLLFPRGGKEIDFAEAITKHDLVHAGPESLSSPLRHHLQAYNSI